MGKYLSLDGLKTFKEKMDSTHMSAEVLRDYLVAKLNEDEVEMAKVLMCGGDGWVIKVKAGTTCQGLTNSASEDKWMRSSAYKSMQSNNGKNCVAVAYVSGYGTSMATMFSGCTSLTSLDLSALDTSNVTVMYYMFNGCTALTSLDLSNFDTSKVTAMDSMFNGCSSLATLDLSSFDTSNVTVMDYMFNKCTSLRYITLGKGFFGTKATIPFSGATNLGLNADGTDNGWLAHLASVAPTITDGTARTIQLPSALKALSTSADIITKLQEKGYTVA